MSHALDGAQAKLALAREHLATLDKQVDEYLDGEPFVFEPRLRKDGDRRWFQIIASASTEPPDRLGLVVGDWAHNMRGALDYTVYELVRDATQEPDPRWTQFPIATTETAYKQQAPGRLKGVPVWALPVFDGLQPYHDEDEAEWHPLAILADISNRDKHRLVHTTAMQIAGSQAQISGTSMWTLSRLDQNPGAIIGERVVLDAEFTADGDDVQIGLNLAPSVGLEQYEFPLVPMLQAITFEVESIVRWFIPAIP
jgi:hypothetical protein